MPTSIDTFFTVITAARVLSSYQDNMRTNTQNIQRWYHGTLVTTPPSPLLNNLAATQQALRDFGKGCLDALAPLEAAFTAFPTELTAAAVAPLPRLTDLTAAHTLLKTWATNMNTVTLASGADLDTKVAALLAAVPARMLPF